MSIPALAQAKPLQKDRLRIRLEFGRHQTADDARSLNAAFESFKPHIYVPEKAGLGDDDRLKVMAEMNELLHCRTGAQELMEHSVSITSMFGLADFAREEMRIVARNRPKGLYLAESGVDQGIWEFAFMMMDMMQSAQAAAELMLKGQTESALGTAEQGLRRFVKPALIDRNALVAEGMERLLSEAPSLFPRLPSKGAIRVLVRYGTTHAALAEILESRGFSVETGRIPGMDFRGDLCLRLSRDFVSPLTREEGMRLIFNDLFNEATSESECSEEAIGAAIRQAYAHIGGASGFQSMLDSAALTCPEPEHSIESVKRTLAVMAGNIGGGMHG
jgi:hypothetical protein